MPDENKPQEETTTDAAQIRRPSIRTFRADASEFIKNKKLSLVDLVAMKQRGETSSAFYPAKKDGPIAAFFKNKNLLVVVLLLVILGILGLYFFLTYERETVPVIAVLPPPAIIVNQGEEIIDISAGKDIKTQILNFFKTVYKPGDMIYMPVKKVVPLVSPAADGSTETTVYLNSNDFLAALKSKAPASLTTFLQNNFFLGIINLDKNHPILIFEAEKDHEETVFSGMLSWEKTMLTDLSFMLINQPTSTATPFFKDKILENNQMRIAEKEGAPILIYTFLNKKFILITDSENAIKELIKRFVLFKFS